MRELYSIYLRLKDKKDYQDYLFNPDAAETEVTNDERYEYEVKLDSTD